MNTKTTTGNSTNNSTGDRREASLDALSKAAIEGGTINFIYLKRKLKKVNKIDKTIVLNGKKKKDFDLHFIYKVVGNSTTSLPLNNAIFLSETGTRLPYHKVLEKIDDLCHDYGADYFTIT